MVYKDSGNSGQSPNKTSKLRKGSGVDGKARGSREEWKWIGSPLTADPISHGELGPRTNQITDHILLPDKLNPFLEHV